MNENFPILNIMPITRLVLHEQTDPQRIQKLKLRFKKEGNQINPVIVTPLKKDKFLVLDGANRVATFLQMRIPHIFVQIVPYKQPQIKLKTWNHLICDRRFKIAGSKPIKRFKVNETQAMLDFVSLYKGKNKFHRVIEDNFKLLKKQYPDATCLAVFPRFSSKDIKKLVLQNQKIPAGITRHIVSGRALRLKIPLKILKTSSNIVKKNRWLNRFISDKIKMNQVRFYQEPTFLFDE